MSLADHPNPILWAGWTAVVLILGAQLAMILYDLGLL